MRAIVEELPYALANAPKRIYLIDEFQRTSAAAQDVLLKPMEEKRLVAFICTTEAEKIRGAIRSRCEEYTIKKVTRDDIFPRMKVVLNQQNVEHEDDAVLIVIDRAEGHVRNVLNNLEMVAQLGPITVEAVREYLHLSVITVYYQILLHLDEPLRAIEYVHEACELVAPDEVASGIAEAAMNCYRMARKCHVDFSYVDKGLAEQVYGKYQDSVVRFARYFSASKKAVTRLTLELDVLAFSMSAKNLPAEETAPSIVIVSQMASQPQAILTASIAPQPAQQPAQPATPTVATKKTPAARPAVSEDCSPLEEIASSSEMPRKRSAQAATQVTPKKKVLTPVSPGAWRASFDRQMKK